MAKYSVTFSGCIEVEDASSEENAIAHVQNYNLVLDELEFEAKEVEEDENDANLYREHKGYKVAEDGTLVEVEEDEITRQDIQEAIEILNCYEVGTFVFYPCDNEHIHRIRDIHSNTILIGNTKRELYEKIHAFLKGIELLGTKIANNLPREEDYKKD